MPHWTSLDQFFLPLDRMLQRFTGSSIGTKRLVAEGLLIGEQVTVEGYAYGGKADIFGVVDSVMFPGTLAFSRFDYPSSLPDGVQKRMAEIAASLIEGMGFDHGLFNVEMMYDAGADRIAIIEINPRMASQFADLYEKVDGTSSYTVLLDIARGRTPRFTRRQGRYGFASSFVLRSFEDYIVAALPTEADLERLAQLYPDIRVELHGTLGRKLSAELQDGRSYRYGIVSLGGSDRADVLAQYENVPRPSRHLASADRPCRLKRPPSPPRRNSSSSGHEPNSRRSVGAHVLLDPVRERRHPRVDAREQGIAALRTPAHDPDLGIAPLIVGGDDQRSAAVAEAGNLCRRSGRWRRSRYRRW